MLNQWLVDSELCALRARYLEPLTRRAKPATLSPIGERGRVFQDSGLSQSIPCGGGEGVFQVLSEITEG